MLSMFPTARPLIGIEFGHDLKHALADITIPHAFREIDETNCEYRLPVFYIDSLLLHNLKP